VLCRLDARRRQKTSLLLSVPNGVIGQVPRESGDG
jgi:hypothetical protein